MTPRTMPNRVLLVTEATYPHKHGGVSVWCDRLISGLDDVSFDVVALCADERETVVWTVPPNVTSVTLLPLNAAPAGDPRHRRPSRTDRSEFAGAVEAFVASLAGEPGRGSGTFLEALKRLYRATRTVPIGVGLWLPDTFDAFVGAWNRIGGPRSASSSPGVALATAIKALSSFEPLLRPFEYVPSEAEVVHVTANGLAMLIGLAHKWEHGTPVVLTEHGVYIRERYLQKGADSSAVRQLQLRFFAHLAAAGLQESDLIAPVSDFNRRWEIRSGADDGRIRVIKNGVDPSLFRKIKTEPATPTLVYVGRIDPLKDLETLLEAFALVLLEEPEAMLRIFGPVPPGNEEYMSRLTERVVGLGLERSVVFEGNTGDVSSAHRQGHVVVLASISEGLPFSVIEAMMSGRATVSTDVGGVTEVVGDAGLVVPARDPKAFAEACVRLLRDRNLRRVLGERARRRAMRDFTIGGFLADYRRLYEDVVGMRAETEADREVPLGRKAMA